MSHKEHAFTDECQPAQINGESLISDAAMEQVVGLTQAHHGYEVAEMLHDTDIKEIGGAIKELEKQKADLEGQRDRARRKQFTLRHQFNDGLTALLEKNDENINPIYAATLLAPTLDDGSLWYPETFAIADRLGKNLVQLDRALIDGTESVPVAAFRSQDSDDQNLTNMHIDYGFTKPGEGLVHHIGHIKRHAGCGSYDEKKPSVEIQVEEATLGAVEVRRGYFVTASGNKLQRLQGNVFTEAATSWIVPQAQTPNIPLSTGNLYQDDYLLARYDTKENDIELHGPKKLGDSPVICAIGERAVKTTLIDLQKKAQNTNQQPEVFRDISQFVASELGVSIDEV